MMLQLKSSASWLIETRCRHDGMVVVEGLCHAPKQLRKRNNHEAVEYLVRAAPDVECAWR